jgi:hypothetical protein
VFGSILAWFLFAMSGWAASPMPAADDLSRNGSHV